MKMIEYFNMKYKSEKMELRAQRTRLFGNLQKNTTPRLRKEGTNLDLTYILKEMKLKWGAIKNKCMLKKKSELKFFAMYFLIHIEVM